MGKTAVVIIHGVGEQHPMGTVRGFAQFFAGKAFRSKPDRSAEFYELRRLSTFATGEKDAVAAATIAAPGYPPDTVFYEYYWAFHFRDTTVALIVQWVLATLRELIATGSARRLRWPVKRVALRWIVVLLAVAVTIVVIGWGVSGLIRGDVDRTTATGRIVVGSLVPALLWLIRPIFLGWVGDAARYFSTAPATPVERQQIRAEGIALLKRLHERLDSKGGLEYDRIIVVGHSLGSVIAYDLLATYWVMVNTKVEIDRTNSVLAEMEVLTKSGLLPVAPPTQWVVQPGLPTAAKFAEVQGRLAAQIRSPDWRITDLVTLGSPLTHARFLLARTADELQDRQRQRELPLCPPVRDEVQDETGRTSFVFSYEPVTKPGKVVGHHAAPFMLTRWTNLYFPHDPIGGPLAPFFGWGIRDVKLEYGGKSADGLRRSTPFWTWFLDLMGGVHNRYWELARNDPKRAFSKTCAEHLWAIVHR